MAKSRNGKLKGIVEALKKEFNPSRMFLFGSRANGSARADSDYDFVLVVPGDRKSRVTNLERGRRVVRDQCGADADVWVYSQREFDAWKDDFSSIPETALNTGKEIDLG